MTASLAASTPHGQQIGLSYETSANLFYRDLAEGVREAAAARGVGVLVRECAQSPERQRADIRDLLAQGIAALVISPVDAAAVAGVMAEVQAGGVPIFTVDRALPDVPVVSHVTSDNRQGGRLAADLLASLLGSRGEVAIVGLPTGTSIAERIEGFKEALARHSGLSLVEEAVASSDRECARQVTVRLLQTYPRLGGIFAVNDVIVQGVLDAIRETGRAESIMVVGYDATPHGCAEIIRGGPLRGEVAQFPMRLGHTVVDLWDQYRRGTAVPQRVEVQVELVTRENVERFTGAERLLRVRRGEVWTAGERVVFFPVRGYQMMLNEIHAASPDLVRHIVYRSGFVLGESIAAQVSELYPDPHDRLFVLLEDLSRSGFGTFELLSLDIDAGRAEVRGHDLFETAIAPGLAWARTPRCVDNYCSGRLAGYATAIFGRPAVCEEVCCQARGDPACRFVMTAEAT